MISQFSTVMQISTLFIKIKQSRYAKRFCVSAFYCSLMPVAIVAGFFYLNLRILLFIRLLSHGGAIGNGCKHQNVYARRTPLNKGLCAGIRGGAGGKHVINKQYTLTANLLSAYKAVYFLRFSLFLCQKMLVSASFLKKETGEERR